MSARLALFDLDNTLLAGDSDHAWGEFLIAENLVDAVAHRERNDSFYTDYQRGELNIHEYVKFTLGPILNLARSERDLLHEKFLQQAVMPMLQSKAEQLLHLHKEQKDCSLIITATNSFITAPIARLMGIDILLATDLEVVDDMFTGNIAGVPCYQDGKVLRLQQWIAQQDNEFKIEEAIFYSDSVNDLPLLESVAEPVAVDPDPELAEIASKRNWRVISLRS